ncbi:ASCH domain-containing protein [Halomicroarcula limicola]|uniref:ASCH domain-containing protein n=1 Tax=Haloarcula limicola TaxID=1429915 RepID=A0A8J7YBD9_9EURY|nr:ASCH domain-containing protein [Halomicroarcula limicola]MBV0924156.1 ASCH domain-containing protein [Halomicroarcula limicola]
MAHIDAGELLPNEHVQRMAADGEITQMHRGHRYADEGDTFDIDGTTYEVTDVTERTLGDLTDEDARREGSADLDAYRDRLARVHDEFEWDDDNDVVRHRFAPTDSE